MNDLTFRRRMRCHKCRARIAIEWPEVPDDADRELMDAAFHGELRLRGWTQRPRFRLFGRPVWVCEADR